MNRNVWLLFCCQALMNAVMSGQTVMSALIGHALAVDKSLNTLPMAIQMTATMTASIPAGIVFARLGRKPGFWLGCAGSLLGSLTFALGVWTQNFQVYCIGAVFAGLGFGIAQHLRFAAAEVAAAEARTRAIALVMAGGVLAAIIGPEIVKRTNMLLPPLMFLGTYLCITVLPLISATLLLFIRAAARGAPGQRAGAVPHHHRPPELPHRRRLQHGRLRHDEPDHGLDAAADAVLRLRRERQRRCDPRAFDRHVPAGLRDRTADPALRRASDHLHRRRADRALRCHQPAVPAGARRPSWWPWHCSASGWNFMFVGGTTLLATAHDPHERVRVQATNDFIVFGTVACTAFASGAIEATGGWAALNLVVAAADRDRGGAGDLALVGPRAAGAGGGSVGRRRRATRRRGGRGLAERVEPADVAEQLLQERRLGARRRRRARHDGDRYRIVLVQLLHVLQHALIVEAQHHHVLAEHALRPRDARVG